MVSNHLIVGLGGTGGKVIRALRKRIFETFRQENAGGVNIRYLYVDSSDEMMAQDDPSWRILGHSVQLSKTSQLLIQGLNLSQVLDNLGSYPGIAPWLGSKDEFRNILNSANAANVVGGQKRRLGRFLFACRAGQYRDQVRQLVKEMETGGTAAVTFHVCCGLAGGTGSGSIADAVAQLRMMFPTKQYRILIYTQLPDRFPAPNRAGSNYHANGYAALRELNGLSTGAYLPFDVSGERPGRQQLQDPFNCCYLYSDENEDHNRVDIDKELPEMVASFLYEKIVTNEKISWNSIRRMESFENMDFRPEESPSGRHPERSRLFFAFGVKQIAYPEEEIREYLTYTFARQASLQLIHNRWSDDFGYIDEPANLSFSEMVRSREAQEYWHVTDERLQLSEGILPDEVRNKRWKPIGQFWTDLIPNFKSHIRETCVKNEAGWLDELQKLCEVAYSQNYRDLGVRKFYEAKIGEQREHLRELRRRIEDGLFQEWNSGAKSIQDVSRVAAALTSSLEERLGTLDDKSAKARENESAVVTKLQANNREWAKLGPLSRALGKANSIFDAQGEVLQQLYIIRTRIEALEFQKRLMRALIGEVGMLASEIGRASSMMVDALKTFTGAMQERCADEGQTDLQKQVVRFYDPAAVKDFGRGLVRDRGEQQKLTAAVRMEVTSLLGDSLNFAAFNTKVGRKAFVSTLEATCERMAVAAHNNALAANPGRARILGVNIVARMQGEYDGNLENLRAYVTRVVSKAKNHLCFNDAEVNRKGPGVVGSSMVCQLAVSLPESREHAEFRAKLEQEIINATPGAKEIVSANHRANEITMISLANLFPLRFVADVAFLRDQYMARLTGPDAAQASMELHSDKETCTLSDVFIETVDPTKLLGNLLVARAMNLVHTLEDPHTGAENLYLIARDHRGRDLEPQLLGKNLNAVAEDAEPMTYDVVAGAVTGLLGSDYLHRARRDELLKQVEQSVGEVRLQHTNPLDKTIRLYSQALSAAERVLEVR